MNKRKKIVVSVILAAVLVIGCVSVALAANLGTLQYWGATYEGTVNEPDTTDSIGRCPATSLVVKTTKLSDDGAFQFILAVQDAVTQWKTALGKNITTSSSATYPDIDYFGGTTEELLTYTGISIPNGVAGRTIRVNYYVEGTWTYAGVSKTGYYQTLSYCFIRNGSTNDIYNTAAHELGHALGWMGHTENRNDVMHYQSDDATTLSNLDKNHLKQVY